MAGTSLSPVSGEPLHLTELRVILLGGRNSGKSSVANLILGREEFVTWRRTAQCVKKHGGIGGRKVTVVDTPGWWCDFTVSQTPRLIKMELERSVSLCPPGPHAFLLVVKVSSSFTEKRRRAVEEHLELLSTDIWRHTIVLFTNGSWLGDVTIDRHISHAGKALQWLTKKCTNRYHVLNHLNWRDSRQVTEIVKKIHMIVAENKGCHYQISSKVLQKVEDRWKAAKERASQRMANVHMIRSLLMGKAYHLTELRIVLLGARWAGKSSVGNAILGERSFETGKRTAQCVRRLGRVSGRHVTIIDTPGWWMNYFLQDSTELDKLELVHSMSLCPPGPHVVLLVIRVDRSFTETYRRAVEEHVNLFGEDVWSHTIVLFNFGDCLGDVTPEQHIESEGKALQWLAEKCGNRYHVIDNENGGDTRQVPELLQKIDEMVAGNRGCHFKINREASAEVKKRRKQVEKNANERLMHAQEKRKQLNLHIQGERNRCAALRIVLLGCQNTGKSSAGNTILGKEEFETGESTSIPVSWWGETCGRWITVTDTPGWQLHSSNNPKHGKTNACHRLRPETLRPHAYLLVLNISSSFTEIQRAVVAEHLGALGGSVWGHTMLVFTNGDWLGESTVEQYIDCEGRALHWLVDRCENRYHVLNNRNKQDRTQVIQLLEHIEDMVKGEEQERWAEKVLTQNQLKSKANSLLPIHSLTCASEVSRSAEAHAPQSTVTLTASAPRPFLPRKPSAKMKTTEQVVQETDKLDQTRTLATTKKLFTDISWRQLTEMDALNWLCLHLIQRHGDPDVGPSVTLSSSEAHTFFLAIPSENFAKSEHLRLERNGKCFGQGFRKKHLLLLSQTETTQRRNRTEFDEDRRVTEKCGGSTIEELESFIDSYFKIIWEHPAATVSEQNCLPEEDRCSPSGSYPDGRDAKVERVYKMLLSIDEKLSGVLEEVRKSQEVVKQILGSDCQIAEEIKNCNGILVKILECLR